MKNRIRNLNTSVPHPHIEDGGTWLCQSIGTIFKAIYFCCNPQHLGVVLIALLIPLTGGMQNAFIKCRESDIDGAFLSCTVIVVGQPNPPFVSTDTTRQTNQANFWYARFESELLNPLQDEDEFTLTVHPIAAANYPPNNPLGYLPGSDNTDHYSPAYTKESYRRWNRDGLSNVPDVHPRAASGQWGLNDNWNRVRAMAEMQRSRGYQHEERPEHEEYRPRDLYVERPVLVPPSLGNNVHVHRSAGLIHFGDDAAYVPGGDPERATESEQAARRRSRAVALRFHEDSDFLSLGNMVTGHSPDWYRQYRVRDPPLPRELRRDGLWGEYGTMVDSRTFTDNSDDDGDEKVNAEESKFDDGDGDDDDDDEDLDMDPFDDGSAVSAILRSRGSDNRLSSELQVSDLHTIPETQGFDDVELEREESGSLLPLEIDGVGSMDIDDPVGDEIRHQNIIISRPKVSKEDDIGDTKPSDVGGDNDTDEICTFCGRIGHAADRCPVAAAYRSSPHSTLCGSAVNPNVGQSDNTNRLDVTCPTVTSLAADEEEVVEVDNDPDVEVQDLSEVGVDSRVVSGIDPEIFESESSSMELAPPIHDRSQDAPPTRPPAYSQKAEMDDSDDEDEDEPQTVRNRLESNLDAPVASRDSQSIRHIERLSGLYQGQRIPPRNVNHRRNRRRRARTVQDLKNEQLLYPPHDEWATDNSDFELDVEYAAKIRGTGPFNPAVVAQSIFELAPDGQLRYWRHLPRMVRDLLRFQRRVANELLLLKAHFQEQGTIGQFHHPLGSVVHTLMGQRRHEMGPRWCREHGMGDDDSDDDDVDPVLRVDDVVARQLQLEEYRQPPRCTLAEMRMRRERQFLSAMDAVDSTDFDLSEITDDESKEDEMDLDEVPDALLPQQVVTVKIPGTASQRNAFGATRLPETPADGTRYRLDFVRVDTGVAPEAVPLQFIAERLDPFLMRVLLRKYNQVRDIDARITRLEHMLPRSVLRMLYDSPEYEGPVELSDEEDRLDFNYEEAGYNRPDPQQTRIWDLLFLGGIPGYLYPQHYDTELATTAVDDDLTVTETLEAHYGSMSPSVHDYIDASRTWAAVHDRFGFNYLVMMGQRPFNGPPAHARMHGNDVADLGIDSGKNQNLRAASLVYRQNPPVGEHNGLPANPVLDPIQTVEPDYNAEYYYSFQSVHAQDYNVYGFEHTEFGYLYQKYRHDQMVRHFDYSQGNRNGVVYSGARPRAGRYRLRRGRLRSYESVTAHRMRGGGEANANPILSLWRVPEQQKCTFHCGDAVGRYTTTDPCSMRLRALLCGGPVVPGTENGGYDVQRDPERWCHAPFGWRPNGEGILGVTGSACGAHLRPFELDQHYYHPQV